MSTFQAATDTKNKIKLESFIAVAEWLTTAAVGCGDAPLKVITAQVGEGATIEIKGKSSEGKAPGTIKGKVYGNCFVGELPIPEKVTPGAQIWFEAKLPKHGLTLESNEIPARPPIKVNKICWDRKEVHRKDIVKMTMELDTQYADGTPATVVVYEYNSAGHHDSVARIPTSVENNKVELQWEFNYWGSTEQIPKQDELKPHNQNYSNPQFFFVVLLDMVRIGAGQEGGLLKFVESSKLRIFSKYGNPLKNGKVTLLLADGSKQNVTTDGDGWCTVTVPGRFAVQFS